MIDLNCPFKKGLFLRTWQFDKNHLNILIRAKNLSPKKANVCFISLIKKIIQFH